MIASDIFLFSYDGNKEYSKNRLQELGGLRICKKYAIVIAQKI